MQSIKFESFKLPQDAAQYYATTSSPNNKKRNDHQELKAECYIGFQKLLNEELKAFDIKDSIMMELKLTE